MGFTIPTTGQFKSQFQRDFPYAVPGYGAAIALTISGGVITSAQVLGGGTGYASGASVTVTDTTGSGADLTATVEAGVLISVAIVHGGTNYSSSASASLSGGDDTNQKRVTDTDISGAIEDAQDNINEGLFPNQDVFNRAFLFLTAHCLVENLLASVEGLASQFGWLTAAKSVDGVSQSFVIPDRVKDDPFLSLLSTTRYGARYLQIVMPYTVGHVMSLHRETGP